MSPVFPHVETGSRNFLKILLLGVFAFGCTLTVLILTVNGAQEKVPKLRESAVSKQASAVRVPAAVEITPTEISQNKCTTKQEYLMAIEKYLPSLVVEHGSESTRIETSNFASCLIFHESKAGANDCAIYSAELHWQCVDDVLRKSVKEKDVVDTVSGVGGKVGVKRSDWLLDYNALTTSVLDQFSKVLHFNTIMSASKSSALVIQAPKTDTFPGTDGTWIDKYIEVDGSRQLLFLWEGGKYEMFHMSGAFPQWNPVGVYRIVDKSPLSWSSTASKWMPYWMPFTYDNYQDAALGIHALVYWYPGLEKTGSKKVYESESHIGTPRSTGCMRLRTEDAKYVYERTRVGDPVVIHD